MEGDRAAVINRDVSDKYKKLQKEWKLYETTWGSIHYVLGIVAAGLAFLSSSEGLAEAYKQHVPIMAGIAGMLAAIVTFLSPASRRKAYTEACNVLRICRLRYETQPEITEKDLNNAVERAQNIIAQR